MFDDNRNSFSSVSSYAGEQDSLLSEEIVDEGLNNYAYQTLTFVMTPFILMSVFVMQVAMCIIESQIDSSHQEGLEGYYYLEYCRDYFLDSLEEAWLNAIYLIVVILVNVVLLPLMILSVVSIELSRLFAFVFCVPDINRESNIFFQFIEWPARCLNQLIHNAALVAWLCGDSYPGRRYYDIQGAEDADTLVVAFAPMGYTHEVLSSDPFFMNKNLFDNFRLEHEPYGNICNITFENQPVRDFATQRANYADVVTTKINEKDFKKVIIVGLSMGGTYALSLANDLHALFEKKEMPCYVQVDNSYDQLKNVIFSFGLFTPALYIWRYWNMNNVKLYENIKENKNITIHSTSVTVDSLLGPHKFKSYEHLEKSNGGHTDFNALSRFP
ncbi:MAG: hypothetical protein CMF42_03325 [Legionellales bacterium]|nr:hypothetical protein [Legionellales bacterium]